MAKLFFKAELLDDIVLSLRTATAGDHKSLDYIPGSVFLGVAASRLYSTVSAKSAETAWELFHTSKVRFYNAYPLMNDKRAIPMPLSIHSEKVPRPGKEKEMLNFASSNSKLEENVQYRQNRSGYVFFENAENDKSILNVFSPSKTSRMRTAINAQTGTAEKAQLYGYESLNAGQVFVGIIEGDDSVSDIEAVKKLFSSGEIIHIGRSKTASYGRVKVSELKDYKETSISENALSGTSFSILAVSDLCLRNPLTGTPELTLSPSYLGLGDDWKCDKERSFSRYSNVYQYNAYRKEIEIQKTLLSKGSIFTFKSNKPLSEDEKKKVLAALQNGIGDAKGARLWRNCFIQCWKRVYKGRSFETGRYFK